MPQAHSDSSQELAINQQRWTKETFPGILLDTTFMGGLVEAFDRGDSLALEDKAISDCLHPQYTTSVGRRLRDWSSCSAAAARVRPSIFVIRKTLSR